MTNFILIFTLLLTVFCSPTRAEPGAAAKYLMDTPVDWLTFGQVQLEHRLQRRVNDYDISVFYWTNSNELKIEFWRFGPTRSKFKSEAQSECEQVINMIKHSLSFDSNGRYERVEFDPLHEHAPMAFDFRASHPAEFRSKGEPKDLGQQLENITTIVGQIYYNNKKEHKLVECRSKLTEGSITYKVL